MKNFIKRLLVREPKEKFAKHYDDWRDKRIKAIIDHYGEKFFEGKRLLEVGCGHGDIGIFFSKLGAIVTCSDAREEHLKVINEKAPNITTVVANLESEWPFKEKFDIIINFGVIYHISNPDYLIEQSCINSNHLILETIIADSDDETFIVRLKENGYDQAFSGTGCRPSAKYMERIYEKCGKKYEMIIDDRCNSDFHVYDWKVKNKGDWMFKGHQGKRRFWFIENK